MFNLPNIEWNKVYANLEIALSSITDIICYIDLTGGGQIAFMQRFESKIASILGVFKFAVQ